MRNPVGPGSTRCAHEASRKRPSPPSGHDPSCLADIRPARSACPEIRPAAAVVRCPCGKGAARLPLSHKGKIRSPHPSSFQPPAEPASSNRAGPGADPHARICTRPSRWAIPLRIFPLSLSPSFSPPKSQEQEPGSCPDRDRTRFAEWEKGKMK